MDKDFLNAACLAAAIAAGLTFFNWPEGWWPLHALAILIAVALFALARIVAVALRPPDPAQVEAWRTGWSEICDSGRYTDGWLSLATDSGLVQRIRMIDDGSGVLIHYRSGANPELMSDPYFSFELGKVHSMDVQTDGVILVRFTPGYMNGGMLRLAPPPPALEAAAQDAEAR